jgi:phosphatidylglycerol---prolipoprotein diacylglyceryl transferase
MYPILFSYGPFKIYTYGFFLALAFLIAMYVAGREAKRRGGRPEQIYDLTFYGIIAAIIGSRLFDVILKWDYFAAHPLEIFMLWKGGLAFQGGLILGLLTILFYIYRHKMPLWTTLDIMAMAMPLGQFIGRLGCFMAGCCYGKECHLPWAVTFNNPNTLGPIGVPVHPTELYESFLSLGVFFFLLWFRHRQNFPGQILGVYFLLAGVVRFLVEFFRGDERGPELLLGMPSTQLIALGIAVGATIFLFWRSRAAQAQAVN